MDTRKRVLVIDDDDDFRAVVRTLLLSAGYEVLEAASGREGLEQLADVRPDVVVLDVMMESPYEGYGVNQAIKFQPGYEELRGVPIIMVSSVQQGPEELFLKAEAEAGMVRPDRYLTKPLDVPRFLAAIAQVASPAHSV